MVFIYNTFLNEKHLYCSREILSSSMFFKCGLSVPVLDYLLLNENITKFTSISF